MTWVLKFCCGHSFFYSIQLFPIESKLVKVGNVSFVKGKEHIFSGSETALTQGKYRWHHVKVLTTLTDILEMKTAEQNMTDLCKRRAEA